MQTNNTDHKNFFEQRYKKRRRTALYKLLVSAAFVLLFFNLAWYLPRNFERTIFTALAAVSIVFFFFEAWSVLGNSWRTLKFGKSYPQYIYEKGYGLAFFEEKDMQMCKELAAHGYRLLSVSFGLYKFERALPEECDFFVDFTDIKVNSEGFEEYLEGFENGGWYYVCSTSALHFFRAPKGQPLIFTNSASLNRKHKKMRSLSIYCVIAGLFTALFSLWFAHIFPYPIAVIFRLLLGVGIGLSLAMSVSALLNHRMLVRLRKLQSRHGSLPPMD